MGKRFSGQRSLRNSSCNLKYIPENITASAGNPEACSDTTVQIIAVSKHNETSMIHCAVHVCIFCPQSRHENKVSLLFLVSDYHTIIQLLPAGHSSGSCITSYSHGSMPKENLPPFFNGGKIPFSFLPNTLLCMIGTPYARVASANIRITCHTHKLYVVQVECLGP